VFCTAAARSAELIASPTAPVLILASPIRITPGCLADVYVVFCAAVLIEAEGSDIDEELLELVVDADAYI